MTGQAPNVCAGPFGAFYDFYIERPRLMQAVGRAIWGIDASILYASMEPIEEAGSGAVIADVPCGGGVAFRALAPDQDVRYVAADLSPKMLRRAHRRAAGRSLRQVELVQADMTSLPLSDTEVDLFLSFSGLHMIPEPEKAVAEIGRCLRPGGRLVGTTFLSDGSRRARDLQGRQLPRPCPSARSGSTFDLARNRRPGRHPGRTPARVHILRGPQALGRVIDARREARRSHPPRCPEAETPGRRP